MAFDACGTTRLEGNEIMNRMAKYLEVDPMDLAIALKFYTQQIKEERTRLPEVIDEQAILNDQGC